MSQGQAIFGRPITSVMSGGLYVVVNAITLHKGKVILFDKPGVRPGGQDLGNLWFPWDFLSYGEAPEAACKRVLKQWGKCEPKTMNLVEVFSVVPPGESWHLAFQYIVELKAPAKKGANIKDIKDIEQRQLPRMVGWLRRSDIKRYLTLAGAD
jgi:ADP-ribose pyrophosphatase YjhB (NUDIX family)